MTNRREPTAPLPSRARELRAELARFAGPGSWTVDLGIGKNFPIREKMRLQFKADTFNALNHVNYGNPSTTITNTSFGLIPASDSIRSCRRRRK